MTQLSNDPLGLAVHDYFFLKIDHPLTVHAEGFDPDTMQPSYFFRSFNQMPVLEKEALKRCRGKVLDIGACAGAHAMWLQQKGFQLTAMETSSLCCEVMKQRGIEQVICANIFEWEADQFDTILLLMNGTGIAGTLPRLPELFQHLKKILKPNGQILIDSSDLIYLFEDETGEAMIDVNSDKYYGELDYCFEYKNTKGELFSWLYTDAETLEEAATKAGLKITGLVKGEHHDYLAIIE